MRRQPVWFDSSAAAFAREERGADVPYCTVVEFEWDGPGPRAAFEQVTSGGDAPADGRLVRIVGIDERGARAIEVWGSQDDARRFAETAAPALGAAALPAPSRVYGFEVTSFGLA